MSCDDITWWCTTCLPSLLPGILVDLLTTYNCKRILHCPIILFWLATVLVIPENYGAIEVFCVVSIVCTRLPSCQYIEVDLDCVMLQLNLASQSVLEGLNACLDHRAEVYVPELGKTFRVEHGKTRLFACQNPLSQGGGRKGLPKSFLNRFTQVCLHWDECFGTGLGNNGRV